MLSRVVGDDEERDVPASLSTVNGGGSSEAKRRSSVSFIYGRFRWQWVVIDVAFVLGVGKVSS